VPLKGGNVLQDKARLLMVLTVPFQTPFVELAGELQFQVLIRGAGRRHTVLCFYPRERFITENSRSIEFSKNCKVSIGCTL